jgi:hypothetical protein
MTEQDGSGAGAAPVAFPHRERLGRNFWYFSDYPFEQDADHWYDNWIKPQQTVVPPTQQAASSRSYSYNAASIYEGAATGTLKVDLLGYRDGPHYLRLYVNGNLVLDGSPTWDGFETYTVQVDVSQAYFRNDANTIKVEMVVDPSWYVPGDPSRSKVSDEVYVNWVDLVYHDTFVAERRQPADAGNNILAFRNDDAGSWRYEVSNFDSANIEVYDVTDLGDVRRFTGTTISGAGPYGVSFGDVAAGQRRYLALTPSARLLTPADFRPAIYSPSGYAVPDLLRAGIGADYVIISHTNFWADAQRLAQHRSKGFRVLLVDAQQVYDQFNGGLMSAEAIRDFLAYAHANWSPPAKYAVLLGDGTSDMRNYRYPAPTYIPPYLYLADPDLGETAADNRFVTVTGNDNMPDLHLGRLPANTAADAKAMVDKIIAYETECKCGGWNYNTLFVTDDLESGGGNFYAYSDEVAEGFVDSPSGTIRFVPNPPYAVTKAYLGQTCDVVGNPSPATGCQNLITSTLNDTGALFVSYVGHAGKEAWATESLMSASLLNTLNNAPCLPIMLPMTCSEGSYHSPTTTAVAEYGVRMPLNGAIASWSPTGFGLVTGHDYLEKGLVLALLHMGVDRLGPATTYGKQYLLDNAPAGAYRDLLDTFGLLGDPGLQVKTDAVCSMIPTAVQMAGFRAERADEGVLVSWETENEVDVLGFHVLRRSGDGSDFVPANPDLIFAANGGAAKGSEYTFLDRQAKGPGNFRYALEIVKLDGTSERYGLADVTLEAGLIYLPMVKFD